jgi:predicted esterase
MLRLADQLARPDVVCLAPQAEGNSWYPERFMTRLNQNEPWLSSSLLAIKRVLAQLGAMHIPPERTLLMGFSQGACLCLEYVVRFPRRYGGVAALSGALMGPNGTLWNQAGSLDGTPIFLGCDEHDARIPKSRVEQTAQHCRSLGGQVTETFYTALGHTLHPDELAHVRTMIDQMLKESY